MRRIIVKILWTITLGLIGAKIAGNYGHLYWFFDLFSHWQMQYAGVALVVSLLFAFSRIFFGFLVSLSLAIWCLLPIFRAPTTEPAGTADIYFLNAYYTNSETDVYVQEIERKKPKVVVIVELNDSLRISLRRIGYEQVTDLDSKYDSQGIFTRSDITPRVLTAEIDNGFPYPIGQVKIDNLNIFAIHPFPGLTWDLADNQESLFAKVSTLIGNKADAGENFVLLGDFNSSIFSPKFQKYFSRFEAPLLYTWYRNSIRQLPIDHAIGNIPLKVTAQAAKTSDHSALIVDTGGVLQD